MHSSSSRSGRTTVIVVVTLVAVFISFVFIALVGVGLYFGLHSYKSGGFTSAPTKGSITNVSSWQLGTNRAIETTGTDTPDISWWNKTFGLPSQDQVVAYLKQEGLVVGRIEATHYTDTKDTTTVTYQVYAQVPSQLLHVDTKTWQPTDPDEARFRSILVLNSGLPAGKLWDADSAQSVADAGSKVTFLWKVTLDKAFNTVATDRPPFAQNVFPAEQINQFRTESSSTLTQLDNAVQQIDTQVQNYENPLLAQVPANPDKPELLSHKWGGDGSGEPTKSAERIGGGTVAGAAAGAGLGAAAGDAGTGAAAGAGAGLLGGLIYDMVSKSNDRKKHDAEVDEENDSRMSAWRAQVKVLDDQRNQIKDQAAAMKDRMLSQLANKISANNGRLDSSISVDSLSATSPTGPVTNSTPIHQQ